MFILGGASNTKWLGEMLFDSIFGHFVFDASPCIKICVVGRWPQICIHGAILSLTRRFLIARRGAADDGKRFDALDIAGRAGGCNREGV